MKALVYGGPGEKSWTDVPDPTIQNPSDVIVKVDTTTICGTDLHIVAGHANYNRDAVGRVIPLAEEPQVLGHEIAGVV